MNDLVVLFLVLVACATGESHDTNRKRDRGTSDRTAPPNNMLNQLRDQLDHAQSNLAYCEFGGNLEYVSLQCKQQKFLELRNLISDVDTPPEMKMAALLASAIAIGCNETALFLCQLLVQYYNKQKDGSHTCISSTIHGPKENALFPCDGKTVERIKEQFKFSEKLTLMYHIASSPLYLTLGCNSIGRVSVEDLSHDLNLSIDQSSENSTEITGIGENPSTKNEDTLIMSYIYKHKSDIQRAELLIESMERTKHSDIDDLKIVDDVNFKFATSNRTKRSTSENDIGDYLPVKPRCSIVGSLHVMLDSVTKSDCLKFCLDDDSCRSAQYTNNKSHCCQLNTETEHEVGPFFTCGLSESNEWDYFEKKYDIVYFLISSKSRGEVLHASPFTSVQIKPFDGDDNQFWFWKDDTIFSKKYAAKALSINIKQNITGYIREIVLENNHGIRTQRWNFENEALTSQYENLRLDIKDGPPKVTASRQKASLDQKWSLSLDRFYFVITCRHSGKVLEASKDHQSRRPGFHVVLSWR